jgi:hypothetical protein
MRETWEEWHFEDAEIFEADDEHEKRKLNGLAHP